MHIAHLALWAQDPEKLAHFYQRYFGARAGAIYTNPRKGFRSRFLEFASGARLEVMHRPGIVPREDPAERERLGYAHLALSVGDDAQVDALTARLIADGYTCLDGPRRTGDGYYESVVLDPEGNRIEITT